MGKNLPASAGSTGSVLDLGRCHVSRSLCAATVEPVLRAQEMHLLSPHAATTEAHASSALLHSKRNHRTEKLTHDSERVVPTRCNWRKACIAAKTQHSQK